MRLATTPTDEVNIIVYPSYDGTNFDTTPMWTMQGDMSEDPQQLSFNIRDVPNFKVTLDREGTTDSHVAKVNVKEYYHTAN